MDIDLMWTKKIELDELERDCDQLWAEALVRYDAGELRRSGRISVEYTTSTIRRYLSERCEIHPRYSVEKDVLYSDYVRWCEAQGLSADPKPWFGRRLRTAFPDRIGLSNYRTFPGDGARRQLYRGLRLLAPQLR